MEKIKPSEWEPIFKDSCEKEKLLKPIEHIAKDILNIPNDYPPGILSGKAGISLFWLYYANFTKSNLALQKATELLNSALDHISEPHFRYDFGSGCIGILWVLNHLIACKTIDADFDEIVGHEINDFIIKSGILSLEVSHCDFFYQGTGALFYALDHIDDKYIEQRLPELFTALRNSAEFFEEGITWSSGNEKNSRNQKVYNLGLAHGLPSIIVLISRMCYKSDIAEDAMFLLKNSIDWLLNKKGICKDNLSLFPTAFCYGVDSFKPSRLGWCYGDLGMAITLLQAGMMTNNSKWIDEGIGIGLHCINRRSLDENTVVDAQFCHGSVGIAHMFNRLYQYTKILDFKDAAKFWYLQTLEMFSRHGFEFKIWKVKEMKLGDFKWHKEYGLIDGVAGIGLALIAAISDEEPKWDRCMLLS